MIDRGLGGRPRPRRRAHAVLVGLGVAGLVGRAVLVGFGLAVLVAQAACADESGPRLATANPAAAARNAMVTLTGSRLCGARGDCATAAGEIQIGLELPTVRATVVGYTDTEAQIVIPQVTPVGRTTLLVTVNERSSNALDFEVLP